MKKIIKNIKKNIKNKPLVIGISLMVIIIMFILFKVVFLDNISKLLGDVTGNTSTRLYFVCSDEINLNTEVTCYLKGTNSTNGISGLTGKITSNSNLEIKSVTVSSDYNNLAEESEESNELTLIYKKTDNPSEYTFATIVVKGITKGTGTLSLVENLEGENVKVALNDENSTVEEFDTISKEITVKESSSSSSDSESSSINNNENNSSSSSSGSTTTNKSSDSSIKSLSINKGTLSPAFDPSTTLYNATVDNDVSSVIVTLKLNDTKASLYNTNCTKTNDEYKCNVLLAEGINYGFISVKAEDGSSTFYRLTITRKEEEVIDSDTSKSKDNTLKSLGVENGTLKPEFSKDRTYYAAVVEDDVETVKINAVPNDTKATVKIIGDFNNHEVNDGVIEYSGIISGPLDVNIVVTAENGSKNYILLSIMRKIYYNENKTEIEKYLGTVTSTSTCKGILSSSKYDINNDSLTIGKVPQAESNDTIKSNISTDCGTISVNNDSLVLNYNNKTKTYKINRYWSPQTGIKVIKYGLILGIIFVITLGLILISKKIKR